MKLSNDPLLVLYRAGIVAPFCWTFGGPDSYWKLKWVARFQFKVLVNSVRMPYLNWRCRRWEEQYKREHDKEWDRLNKLKGVAQ